MAPARTSIERAFALYRAIVAALWCGFPSLGYLWMEKQVTVEALRGNAFTIAAPQLLPVLGVAGTATLGLAALAAAYLLWTDPRAGRAAVLLHDALLVALLAGTVYLVRTTFAPASQPLRESIGASALLTGLFAAEGLFVARWSRQPAAGVALALAYALCVAGLAL